MFNINLSLLSPSFPLKGIVEYSTPLIEPSLSGMRPKSKQSCSDIYPAAVSNSRPNEYFKASAPKIFSELVISFKDCLNLSIWFSSCGGEKRKSR